MRSPSFFKAIALLMGEGCKPIPQANPAFPITTAYLCHSTSVRAARKAKRPDPFQSESVRLLMCI
jgi:hypothetical protein